MKELLIVEAKPIFLESKKDELLERYFDERIETLDKGSIYNLWNSVIQYKNFLGTVYEKYPRDLFITYMSLTYSIDRWLAKKLIDSIHS
jgi:hypothetical protein